MQEGTEQRKRERKERRGIKQKRQKDEREKKAELGFVVVATNVTAATVAKAGREIVMITPGLRRKHRERKGGTEIVLRETS